jgi:hypothetical protein
MDNETLADARQQAQNALSRARIAVDPAIKTEWQSVANFWLARVARLETESDKVQPIIPPLNRSP